MNDAQGVPSNTPYSSHWLTNLILLLAFAIQLARILQVESSSGEVPFLSANDRSRWCTIATLAIQGSYQIDALIFDDSEARRRTPWYSIDLVRHAGPDGRQHYYSSKPPLLPTIYAGVYWLLRATTGLTLMNDPFAVARIMLVVVNLIPLALFWWFYIRWFRQLLDAASANVQAEVRQWSLIVLAFFIAWGTYLSTFVITLNNHLPAALAVALSLVCLDRILLREDHRVRWFVLCGLGTSFGAANELPALSWVAAAGVMLFLRCPRKACLAYLPGLLPVGFAFFALNYVAHGEISPAYAHRDAGPKLFEIDVSDGANLALTDVCRAIEDQNIACSQNATLRRARRENTWEFLDETNGQHFALKPLADSSGSLAVHQWNDWYDYPGSYWADAKKGVDQGEPNRVKYIFHCLFGHHGLFSLTPFWLVSLLGIGAVWSTRQSWNPFRDYRLLMAMAIAATTLVVVGFYFARGLEDRNYGGVTSGFRWTFWLIPLWLWLAVQSLPLARRPWTRRMVEFLVVASVFSASYPWRNPWTSPWIMQWLEYTGWI